MKVIAECIFYIYYQTTITPDEAERVLQLLKEFSRSAKYQGICSLLRRDGALHVSRWRGEASAASIPRRN